MPRKTPAARAPLGEGSAAGSTAGSDHAGSDVELDGADIAAAAGSGAAVAVWADEGVSDAESEQGAAEEEVADIGQGGALLAAAADYLALAQPVVNINEPVMAEALRAPGDVAEAMRGGIYQAPPPPGPPAVVYRAPAQLMSLLDAQRGANVGVGGRLHAFTPIQMEAYLKRSTRLPHVPTLSFMKSPRAPTAQTDLLQTIDTLCRYVGAYNHAHLSQEERTLLWMSTHFTDGAATAFRAALTDARALPSTTGIGREGSVLWRTLFNMVVLYDNPQSKQEAIEALRTLTWKGTVGKTHMHYCEVFKNYQALVAATALNPVATRAGALSWEQKFAYIHAALPDWARTRIRAAPEAVDTEADLWRMLYQHEPVDEKGSGRMFQMAAASKPPSAASSHLEDGWLQLPTEACCLPCEIPSYEEFQQWRPDVQRALFALMASNGKLLKCWRCQGNHRISTCLATPSLAEQQGQHFSTWPDVTPVGSSTPLTTGPLHPARPLSAPTMYVRPTINALPENSPDAVGRVERLEATMTTLANLVAALAQAPRVEPALMPIMALPAVPTPAPLLLVGHGIAPPGYIDVGVAPDGRTLWARADEEAPVPFEALN